MYVIVWEFRAREGREKEFERFYGTRGDWAQFFSGGEGFLGTELIRDAGETRRYLTLDRWVSQEFHERFRSRHAEELTESECQLGSFAAVEDQPV